MAGVVAMASVIEDFDTQPCKKSRKDGGSPVVKTITNYFSPMPKAVEKPFSPPRSNNIMDYFSRKASSSKEKENPPVQSKGNCRRSHAAEKHTSPEVGKQTSQKRRRKSSKAARKLVAAETVSLTDDSSCFIVEESHESKDGVESCVILNEMTSLLPKISNADCVKAEASEITDTKTSSDEKAGSYKALDESSKCENIVKPKSASNTTELSAAVSTQSEVKQVKVASRKAQRKQQREAKHPANKAESSLCDVGKDGVDEASHLNKSTVKISFEDFLRSQNEGKTEEDMKDDKSKEGDCKIAAEKENSGQLDSSKDEENVVSLEPSVQISPRTVTIQAEVHAVSPQNKAVKLVGNLASIFNRKKASPAETSSSPHAETRHQLPFSGVKRKSNVVLQEEDLEVVVLESESSPKCSDTERKQFMAAFKQPSLDGSKTKPGKSQGKQKQAAEKLVDATDNVTEDEAAVPASAKEGCPQNKAAKKKHANKGRSKAKEKNEADISPAATSVSETVTTVVNEDNKTEEPPITSTPSAVRRSRREAVVKQATPTTPVRNTRSQTGLKAAVASSLDSPLKLAAPKTPKSKHGVFVAEIVSSPDVKESPIRIKFSRVCKSVSTSKTEGGNDQRASMTNKASSKSEKRKQAKKLVEKAKMMQQSKKTCVEENTLRRSSRTKTSVQRSYCEDEDSVICMEDLSTTPQTPAKKSKTQKPLRSLNDVLGKTTKDAKSSTVASPGPEMSAQKVSAVVSIFDESSQEGSENSQDDEQFRARREFLKSGLPESFKKQIAKTAATKEAYSLSCSSFQPVTHTTQQHDCSFWSLPWPESSSLTHLKELWGRTSNPLPSVTGSLCVKTLPSCRNFGKKGSGWRPEIPESVRQLLLEEFSTSNPEFPAKMHISHLLKRRMDQQQQLTASEQVAVTKDDYRTTPPAESVVGKRKRKDNEGGNSEKMAKKQRSTRSEDSLSMTEPEAPKRGGRTRRTRRSLLEDEEWVKEKTKSSLESAPSTCQDDAVVVIEDFIMAENARKKDVMKEDVLWTDKYQPQHSSNIIDNTASVKKLHSWLKEWKVRADREDRKNQKDKKHEEGDNDSDWDCGEEDPQDGEDVFCNTMLITGPTGVGKTAAVYACAQELGFKVFEVNASSQRSGRLILSQLKEATQSHQVDSQGVNALKPSYFNSYGTSNSAGSVRPGFSPRKGNSPRRVVSSPRKNPQSPRGARKGGLAPVSLANFFKMSQPINTKKNEQTAPKNAVKANKSGSNHKDPATRSPAAGTPKDKNAEEQNKKTATSLILFEEVDVIFEDDSGFLAAIKTFMTTTKRPVILTTSDPAFSTTFDGSFDEIYFKTPSVLNVGSYLQLLCLAEDVRTHPSDITSLLRLNGCDIRQSLLQLQFWTRSAGGRYSTSSLMDAGKNASKADMKPETDESMTVRPDLPPCDTGCTESKLGLLNIEPERDIWELLRSQSLKEEPVCWDLLTHSRQQGVHLLYSNMETLLPLPLTELATSKPKYCVSLSQDQQPSSISLQSDALPPIVTTLHAAESADCSDSGSPVKVSNRMRKNKKRRRLPEQDGLHSESDSEDSFPSLSKPQSRPQVEEEVEERIVSERLRRKLLTPEERIKSLPVSQCLESIADFLDNMSYVDSSLVFHPHSRNIYSKSAVIKDGMTDESRVETHGGTWGMQSRVLEVQAVVEALSFHKCQASVAEAWGKVQQLEEEQRKDAAAELTLPVAAHQECCSFTQDGPGHPQLIQRRREVMESLMFEGVFGSFCNKSAAALDYLPVVRTICRSERLKEQEKVKRRFLHYLDTINSGIDKSTRQLLAKDFP